MSIALVNLKSIFLSSEVNAFLKLVSSKLQAALSPSQLNGLPHRRSLCRVSHMLPRCQQQQEEAEQVRLLEIDCFRHRFYMLLHALTGGERQFAPVTYVPVSWQVTLPSCTHFPACPAPLWAETSPLVGVPCCQLVPKGLKKQQKLLARSALGCFLS